MLHPLLKRRSQRNQKPRLRLKQKLFLNNLQRNRQNRSVSLTNRLKKHRLTRLMPRVPVNRAARHDSPIRRQ